MPSTLTPAKVRAYANIPAGVVDSTIQIYIDSAYLIVTEDLANSGYTQERLDLIELNLAAHFGVLSYERGGLTFKQVGQASERYQLGKEGAYGLGTTRFGMQVQVLDTLGILAPLSANPLKAQFEVYG